MVTCGFAETGGANALAASRPPAASPSIRSRRTTPRRRESALGPDGNIYFTELSTTKVGRISNLMGGGTVKARPDDDRTAAGYGVHERHRLHPAPGTVWRRRLQRHFAHLRELGEQ